LSLLAKIGKLALESARGDSAVDWVGLDLKYIHPFLPQSQLPCDPPSLPHYPPSKEFDAKLHDDEAQRYQPPLGTSDSFVLDLLPHF
jgi:hypothetical protein